MRINPVYLQSTNKSIVTRHVRHQESPESAGSIAFKSAKVKGFGIGALLGAITVTLLSGGAAAPAVIAGYSLFTGTAAGALGHAVDKTKNDD